MENRNIDSDDNEKILKAIRSLRKDNPLRQQAEIVMADPTVQLEDLQPILGTYYERSIAKANHHIVALWLVKNANLSDDQRSTFAHTLSMLLDTALISRRRRSIAKRWFGRIMLIAIMALFTAWNFEAYIFIYGELMMVTFAVFCGVLWNDNCRLTQSRFLIEAIGHLAEPGTIASIATASKYGVLRESAQSALAEVTANLRPEHYGTLPAQTVPALCDALKKADHITTLVILKALSIIGDGRAIRAVERLALNPPTPDIGAKAKDLLPILKHRELESKAPTQLLRACDAAGNGKVELLRGVSDLTAGDPALLVRAVGAEKE